MRKTLLIAAATLAAGVISSQAQVYSQNIVGYVNIPAVAGFTAMANPLSNNGNNSATNLFDAVSGANDGSIILTWTGTTYAQTAFDSSKPTGFTDAITGTKTNAAPLLAPGQGFLFNNQNSSNTFTFTGSVYTDGTGTGTNIVGVTTNDLSSAHLYVLASSKLPIAGGISTTLGIVNVGGNLDGSVVLVPNIINGAIKGYIQTAFDSSKPTGFTDAITGTKTNAEPVITVGGCFLFSNQTGSDYFWVQSLWSKNSTKTNQ